MNRDRVRGRDSVRDVDELEIEITETDAFARLHRMELDFFIESGLAQLVVGESHRQRRSIDRDLPDPLQLRNDVRQGSDVILVAMGNGDAPQLRQAVLDVADIRDDQVDAALPFLGKLTSGVDDDHVVPVLDGHHALADLADASQRDHPQPAVNSFAGTLLGTGSPASRVLWRGGSVARPASSGARGSLGVPLRSSPWSRPGRALPGRAGGFRLIAALLSVPLGWDLS